MTCYVYIGSENRPVVVGWDRPLQTYFVQAWPRGTDVEDPDTEPLLWAGCHLKELTSVEELARLAGLYGRLPDVIAHRLELDRKPSPPGQAGGDGREGSTSPREAKDGGRGRAGTAPAVPAAYRRLFDVTPAAGQAGITCPVEFTPPLFDVAVQGQPDPDGRVRHILKCLKEAVWSGNGGGDRRYFQAVFFYEAYGIFEELALTATWDPNKLSERGIAVQLTDEG